MTLADFQSFTWCQHLLNANFRTVVQQLISTVITRRAVPRH